MKKNCFQKYLSLSCAILSCCSLASAEIALPSIIGNHMVLQRDAPVPIWGWAEPGEKVQVSVASQVHETVADDTGRWQVELSPLSLGDPLTMTIKGRNTITLEDILVGEVWLCSGQSNMQWAVRQTWNSDLTIAAAKYPNIRISTVETPGVQKPLEDYRGAWEACSPRTIASFSAVGYSFGLQLHQILDVPVGLIDNAWGGSSCEAWVRRDLLQDQDIYAPLLERWAAEEAMPDLSESYQEYEKALFAWYEKVREAKKLGKGFVDVPGEPTRPRNRMVTQHRPGNLYNGRIKPIMPFAIRGAIWYQGESNASRAYQYRELFPLMIQNWRDDWGQGEFPFYWVQLADFRSEVSEPGSSDWAELREAQTMTLDKLPNTGEAVIIDVGEASDIHPRNKLEVGIRLARWALATQYGQQIAHQSPRFASMNVTDGKCVLKFDHVGDGLRTVDQRKVDGFAIAGEDQQWVWADAKITDKNTVEVWSEAVMEPKAVRYAWADNPICNLYSREGLPVTPFRTDDWPGMTAEAR